jgi:hypothetical protein
MTHRGLGRVVHKDKRDHKHLLVHHLGATALPTSKTWGIKSDHLDQGPTSTCVGHGMCNFLRCAPVRTTAGEEMAYRLYKKAVLLDPWKQNDIEATYPDASPKLSSGTTVRAGAKAAASMGLLDTYVWAFSLQPTIEWLLTRGPVVVGVNWYDSMFEPDAKGLVTISPGAQIEGGHCFLLRGANQTKAQVLCTNSWGNGWGKKGDFLLSFKDLERLISEDGEVCTAIQKAA